MNEQDLGELVLAHKWMAATAVAIALVIRLLKSDTKIPINVPPRARIWLVLALGVASSVLDKVATGTPWTKAIVNGLVGAFIAVIGHETVIASIRSGKEIPVPGLMVPGASPSPGAPPTIPPAPIEPVVIDSTRETVKREAFDPSESSKAPSSDERSSG